MNYIIYFKSYITTANPITGTFNLVDLYYKNRYTFKPVCILFFHMTVPRLNIYATIFPYFEFAFSSNISNRIFHFFGYYPMNNFQPDEISFTPVYDLINRNHSHGRALTDILINNYPIKSK